MQCKGGPLQCKKCVVAMQRVRRCNTKFAKTRSQSSQACAKYQVQCEGWAVVGWCGVGRWGVWRDGVGAVGCWLLGMAQGVWGVVGDCVCLLLAVRDGMGVWRGLLVGGCWLASRWRLGADSWV